MKVQIREMADLQAHAGRGSKLEPRSQRQETTWSNARLSMMLSLGCETRVLVHSYFSVFRQRVFDFQEPNWTRKGKTVSHLIIQEPATRLNYDSDRRFNDITLLLVPCMHIQSIIPYVMMGSMQAKYQNSSHRLPRKNPTNTLNHQLIIQMQ